MKPSCSLQSTAVVVQVAVSLGCAVFTGIRGGLFTLAMVRLNVRVRTRLFGSLLSQDVGFFDVNKTGAVKLCAANDQTGAAKMSSTVSELRLQAGAQQTLRTLRLFTCRVL